MTETQTNGQQGGGYTPASFEKRTAAWMGIAYTVMLCFVLNYALYTGGGNLPGTFPLFLIPVSVALAAILIHRRKGRASPKSRNSSAPAPAGWRGAYSALSYAPLAPRWGFCWASPPCSALSSAEP